MFQISVDILLERLSKRMTIGEEKKRKSKRRETHKRTKKLHSRNSHTDAFESFYRLFLQAFSIIPLSLSISLSLSNSRVFGEK